MTPDDPPSKHGIRPDLSWCLWIVLIVCGGRLWIDSISRVSSYSPLSQVESDFRSFESALAIYHLNAGSYPSGVQGLEALVSKPSGDPVPRRWSQYLDKVPLDPWRNAYFYEFPGKKNPMEPEIICSGPDGIRGTSDDLNSEDD